MKLSTAKAMVRRINKREGEGVASLYEGYSGRYMYGDKTEGVVAPFWALPENSKYRRDNMGMDMIIY
ncbi:MAG TPA: hypothetical protein VMW52_10170 [Phycisphaerae bacterium]|nr:hypothetical protein [Phycisphaerae bacterium]